MKLDKKLLKKIENVKKISFYSGIYLKILLDLKIEDNPIKKCYLYLKYIKTKFILMYLFRRTLIKKLYRRIFLYE